MYLLVEISAKSLSDQIVRGDAKFAQGLAVIIAFQKVLNRNRADVSGSGEKIGGDLEVPGLGGRCRIPKDQRTVA